jgi:hypothetical protein
MKPEHKNRVANLLTFLFLGCLLAFGHYLKQSEEAKPDEKQAASKPLVEVALLGKRNRDALYGQQFVDLDFSYKNNASKDITNIKGLLHLADRNGHLIFDLSWEFNGGVPANQTVVQKGAAITVNTDIPDYARLWKTDFDALKSKFVVYSITYKDGSTINVAK